jgi:hypothetical protein
VPVESSADFSPAGGDEALLVWIRKQGGCESCGFGKLLEQPAKAPDIDDVFERVVAGCRINGYFWVAEWFGW